MNGKTIKKNFFTFTGRLNRKPYFMNLMTIGALGIFFILYITTIEPSLKEDPEHFVDNIHKHLIFWVFYSPLFIASLSLGVRRLHDLNKSHWWVILGFATMLVPESTNAIVNLVAVALNYIGQIFNLYLVFAKGTTGPNKYGEDPVPPPKPPLSSATKRTSSKDSEDETDETEAAEAEPVKEIDSNIEDASFTESETEPAKPADTTKA